MQLTSNAFAPQTPIPEPFTCKGTNVSPPLQILSPPPGTQSLVLIMHDPDAPSGDFTHWLVWNIPHSVASIDSGRTPDGAIEGLNDFDQLGYGGPCPPSGTHRYVFELYALDALIDLPTGTPRPALEAAMEKHSIEHTQLIGIVSA